MQSLIGIPIYIHVVAMSLALVVGSSRLFLYQGGGQGNDSWRNRFVDSCVALVYRDVTKHRQKRPNAHKLPQRLGHG
jgi:hypothetical protein